jgi:hypothetical protein
VFVSFDGAFASPKHRDETTTNRKQNSCNKSPFNSMTVKTTESNKSTNRQQNVFSFQRDDAPTNRTNIASALDQPQRFATQQNKPFNELDWAFK